MKRSEFAGVLSAINAKGRRAGTCDPAFCAYWRDHRDSARIVEAVQVWELRHGRMASAGDMESVIAERIADETAMQAREARAA